MKGHVVWCPVSVRVSDVMDCTDSHCNLADRVDNGQVDDSPEEEEKDSGEKSTHKLYLGKSTNTSM